MEKVQVLMFATYRTECMVNDFYNILCSINGIDRDNTVIIFENRDVLENITYQGISVNDKYDGVIEKVNKTQYNTSDRIKNGTLMHYAMSVESDKLVLFGINTEQLRTLDRFMTAKQKKKVIAVVQYDLRKTENRRTITEGIKITNGNIYQTEYSQLTAEEVEKIVGAELEGYEIKNNPRADVYLKEGGKVYKVLKGKYNSDWSDKVYYLKNIGEILNSHKLVNAFPIERSEDEDHFIIAMNCVPKATILPNTFSDIRQELGIDTENYNERIILTEYLMQINRAIAYFHYYGVYFSDIKEDNFFYCNKFVVPIDIDGCSFMGMSASQPKKEYREASVKDDCEVYYHSSYSEAYSLSFMMFKILFDNKQPVYDDRKDKSLGWLIKHQGGAERLNTRDKNSIYQWRALSDRMQTLFEHFFVTQKRKTVYECEDWLPVLEGYKDSLSTMMQFRSLENTDGKEFESRDSKEEVSGLTRELFYLAVSINIFLLWAIAELVFDLFIK